MSDKLKNCPFCGMDVEIKQTGKNKLTIKCPRCKVEYTQKTLRFSLDWLEGEMIKSWNRRANAKCGCGQSIDTMYCEKCRRLWES